MGFWCSRRGLQASSGAVVAVGLALAGLCPGRALAGTLTWGSAQAIGALPAGAPAGVSPSLDSLACSSPGACVAVGDFSRTFHTEPSTGFSEPMAVSESAGRWGRSLQIMLPSNAAAATEQQAGLRAVACAPAGACVALGAYDDHSGSLQSMIVSQSAGVWSRASELMLPSAAGGGLVSLTCPVAGSCVAVGSEEDSFGNSEPIVVSELDGVWGQPHALMLPAHVHAAEGDQLTSVSCPRAGACVAVGDYFLGAADFNPPTSHAKVVSESRGVWRHARAISLARRLRSAGGQEEQLDSIACPSAQRCVAVGHYDEDTSGDAHAMLVTESAGSWGQVTQLSPPAGAESGQFAGLNAVACPASSACVAVGQYDTRGQNTLAMAASESGGAWPRAREVALPIDGQAGDGLGASLESLACPAVGSCLALGGDQVVSAVRHS